MRAEGNTQLALKSHFNKRFLLRTTLIICSILLIITYIGVQYWKRLEIFIAENTTAYSQELVEQVNANMNHVMQEQVEILNLLARGIPYAANEQIMLTMVQAEAAIKTDCQYAMVTEKDTWFMADGTVLENIPLPEQQIYDATEYVLFYVPVTADITYQAQRVCAIVAVVPIDAMCVRMEQVGSSEYGYFTVIQKNGNMLTTHMREKGDKQTNLFAFLAKCKNSDGQATDMFLQEKMQQHERGGVYFATADKKHVKMYFTPLQWSDWYGIVFMPASIFKPGTLKNITLLVFAVLAFLILIIYLMFSQEQARNHQNLIRIAYQDPLTGGANQNYIQSQIEQLLKSTTTQYVVICANVAHFKLINDQLGNETGDVILKKIWQCFQEASGAKELVSRTSGDHFAFLWHWHGENEICARLAAAEHHLHEQLRQLGLTQDIAINYGFYLPSRMETNAATMINRANLARQSTNILAHGIQYAMYDDAIRKSMLQEKHLLHIRENAIKQKEFVVYYQPKYQLQTGQPRAAEALVRWQSPEEGLISPGDFIPLFERDGFIIQLDLYVFRAVCRDIRNWRERGIEPVPVSVNLSRRHLSQPNFLDEYKQIMEDYEIPAALIEFEFTETLVYNRTAVLRSAIDEIHQMGCACSIDDFGSGYSSLNMLKDVQVDTLKLDKAFFDNSDDGNWHGQEIVRSVIGMAERLGMSTVAEGVEQEPQVDFLRSAGCEMVQGYVFSRPLPHDTFEKLLKKKED